MFKRLSLFMVLLLSLLVVLPAQADSTNAVSMTIDGEAMTLPQEPFIENGRTMLPLRAICQRLGMEVEWVPSRQAAELHFLNRNVTFVQGELRYDLDGEKHDLDAPLLNRDGHLYIPIRHLANIAELNITWDAEKRCANLELNDKGDRPKDALVLAPGYGIMQEQEGRYQPFVLAAEETVWTATKHLYMATLYTLPGGGRPLDAVKALPPFDEKNPAPQVAFRMVIEKDPETNRYRILNYKRYAPCCPVPKEGPNYRHFPLQEVALDGPYGELHFVERRAIQMTFKTAVRKPDEPPYEAVNINGVLRCVKCLSEKDPLKIAARHWLKPW